MSWLFVLCGCSPILFVCRSWLFVLCGCSPIAFLRSSWLFAWLFCAVSVVLLTVAVRPKKNEHHHIFMSLVHRSIIVVIRMAFVFVESSSSYSFRDMSSHHVIVSRWHFFLTYDVAVRPLSVFSLCRGCLPVRICCLSANGMLPFFLLAVRLASYRGCSPAAINVFRPCIVLAVAFLGCFSCIARRSHAAVRW